MAVAHLKQGVENTVWSLFHNTNFGLLAYATMSVAILSSEFSATLEQKPSCSMVLQLSTID